MRFDLIGDVETGGMWALDYVVEELECLSLEGRCFAEELFEESICRRGGEEVVDYGAGCVCCYVLGRVEMERTSFFGEWSLFLVRTGVGGCCCECGEGALMGVGDDLLG